MKKLIFSKPLTCVVFASLSGTALGHGLIVDPPSRNAICGMTEKADQAITAACVEAAEEDANGLYQFMSVLTHDIGRMGGPSTHVCGFDSETWQGGATPWDLPLDWPTSPMSSGAQTFTWNISWGPHWDDTEEFRYWITKPGFNYQVGKALSWADFETDPFCVLTYDDTAPNGNPNIQTEKSSSLFHTTCTVPDRSGRHVIYGEWGRNYFTYERFHGCVDVTFGAIGNSSSSSSSLTSSSVSSSSQAQSSTPLASSSSSSETSLATSSANSNSSSINISSSSSSILSSSSSSSILSSSSSSASSQVPTSNSAPLMCDYVVVNEWDTGFVANVRLTNTSEQLVNNWQVQWTYNDGSALDYAWNASTEGANPYTATGVQWNQSILPGQTIEFGLAGSKGGDSTSAVTVTGELCQ